MLTRSLEVHDYRKIYRLSDGNIVLSCITFNITGMLSDEQIWNQLEQEYFMKHPMRTFVFARNFAHFVYWCNSEGIRYAEKNVLYVQRVKDLYGISKNAQFVFLDGWQLSYDVDHVLNIVNSMEARNKSTEVGILKPKKSVPHGPSPTGRITRWKNVW